MGLYVSWTKVGLRFWIWTSGSSGFSGVGFCLDDKKMYIFNILLGVKGLRKVEILWVN